MTYFPKEKKEIYGEKIKKETAFMIENIFKIRYRNFSTSTNVLKLLLWKNALVVKGLV